MARPLKVGLDFFPLDVVMDDNLELLEAEHGLEGFAIVIKLWQKIYQNGYFIEWEQDNALLFSRRINSELTRVNDVINSCLRRNIFNKYMYESYKILTSKAIQKRYDKICSDAKRKNYEINPEFNLINSELIPNKPELTPEESTQSKVEYSTVDKSKADKNIVKSKKASKKFNPPKLEEVIDYVIEKNYCIDPKVFFDYYEACDWIKSNGQRVLNWKGTVVSWNAKEVKENKNAKPYAKKTKPVEEIDPSMIDFIPEDPNA